MVTGRTKGVTFRGKGNVVLVAAQLDDADGNPTEEYVLLRADEFGRLRTIDAGAVATFLGLTDTPASYVGQALQGLRVNAAEDALEFVAPPALTLVGSNTTEATTTSTSLVDMVSVTGLSIVVGTPVFVVYAVRKTSGAAFSARAGLKINSTEVRTSYDWSGATDATESSIVTVLLIHGVANYLQAFQITRTSISGSATELLQPNVDMPTVNITQIVSKGSVANASITTGHSQMHVYTLATS